MRYEFIRVHRDRIERSEVTVVTFTNYFNFRNALECLLRAEQKCEEMKKKKKSLEEEYTSTKNEVAQLLEDLFDKSCLIERMKAKFSKL